MKVGIFGGTFDPIHFGHLHLAITLSETHHLDEVWWIPANVNPHKVLCATPPQHRLAMLKLAIKPIKSFKVLDLELKRTPPSYTVDTLRILKERFPKTQFHLMLGEDLLDQFANWHDPAEIIRIAPPIVGARRSTRFPSRLHLKPQILKAFKQGWTPVPLMEISATDIRNRLKKKEFCGHLIPAKVLDYIHKHHLYLNA